MTPALLAGALVGLGLLAVARGVIARRRPLELALTALAEPPAAARTGVGASTAADSWAFRTGAWVMRLFGADMGGLRADLLVVDRTEEVHLMERIRTAVFLGLAPAVIALVLALGGVDLIVTPTLVAVLCLVLGVFGWFLTDIQLRQRASRRRTEFDSSLVTYLGLVSIATAGGSGINEALWSAVDQGVGWPFQILRRTLADARNRGVSPWDSMEAHASRLELTSLAELAATMKLGGTSGAFVRDSIMTKARSLREHQLAEIEQEANSRTSAMAGPTGLMLAGFLIMLLYPAVVAILSL